MIQPRLQTKAPTDQLAESCRLKLIPDLQAGKVYWIPQASLYKLEFQTLPTAEELNAYAIIRSIHVSEAARAIKSRTEANKAQRKHFLAMADRWRFMSTAVNVRIAAMAERRTNGETMAVYF